MPTSPNYGNFGNRCLLANRAGTTTTTATGGPPGGNMRA